MTWTYIGDAREGCDLWDSSTCKPAFHCHTGVHHSCYVTTLCDLTLSKAVFHFWISEHVDAMQWKNVFFVLTTSQMNQITFSLSHLFTSSVLKDIVRRQRCMTLPFRYHWLTQTFIRDSIEKNLIFVDQPALSRLFSLLLALLCNDAKITGFSLLLNWTVIREEETTWSFWLDSATVRSTNHLLLFFRILAKLQQMSCQSVKPACSRGLRFTRDAWRTYTLQ